MRAVVINQPGHADVLKIENRPIPEADEEHSVLKIHAFGVHRYEVLTREGGSPSVHFPRVIGVEAVGEVYQTLPGSDLHVGQRVITMMGGLGREFDGSYQEYALVPNSQLYPVKYAGSWVDLAQYPETFITAFGTLKELHLNKSQSLLIRGGTTAVGLAMIKLGKAMGLNVAATTRKSDRLQLLLDAGANDAVLDQDGKLQTKNQYDGIVDLVGTPTMRDSLAHLASQGVCCVIGLLAGKWELDKFSPFELTDKYLTSYDSDNFTQKDVDALFNLINQYNLEIPIAKVFPFDEIAAAQDFVMANSLPGAVIVSTDPVKKGVDMTEQELIDLTISETQGYLDHPFNGGNRCEAIKWNAIRHQRNRKIIALIFQRDSVLLIDLKLTPEHGEMMRQVKGVYAGYHMNKTHWNTVDVNNTDLQHQELVGMINESSELTS